MELLTCKDKDFSAIQSYSVPIDEGAFPVFETVITGSSRGEAITLLLVGGVALWRIRARWKKEPCLMLPQEVLAS